MNVSGLPGNTLHPVQKARFGLGGVLVLPGLVRQCLSRMESGKWRDREHTRRKRREWLIVYSVDVIAPLQRYYCGL